MSQITLPLDIKSLEVISQRIDTKGNIVFKVKSKNDCSTCHKCGKLATKINGHAPERKIRHLPIFDQPVYLAPPGSGLNCTYLRNNLLKDI
jgi:transposase